MFTNTLSENAQIALAILGEKKVLPKKTYMAGGSCLALHFGHRISVDFDFFTSLPFSSEDLTEKLKKEGEFKMDKIAKDTLLGQFNDIKFSIFHYKYPLVEKTISYNGINLASVFDIGAMKIAAIMDRGTKKDFIDLYFINKNGISTETCFKNYDKKFGVLDGNLYSIITSLSYFEDAEMSEMPKMIEKVEWREVKKYFEKEAVRLGRKYLLGEG